MMEHTLRIATRKSPLAMWQAQHVKQTLLQHHPQLTINMMGMMTEGDKRLATPLAEIGGKGLFLKELEKAILEHRADIAVHSIKDMPAELPDHLVLATICKREDPRDVLVSNQFESLDALPKGAKLGTCSLRRQFQLLAVRPDLVIRPLRGNINTRLRKLDEGSYDAIVLAAAGLVRMNAAHRITAYLDTEFMLPAAGQGAIGIECREKDERILAWLSPLHDAVTSACVVAERTCIGRLGGGCQMPVAAYATCEGETLRLRVSLGTKDGKRVLADERQGGVSNPSELGLALAEHMLSKGAKEILSNLG